MTAMTTASPTPFPRLPRGRPLTRADLDLMPDDGQRYELIDGMLIVSGRPMTRADLDLMPDDGHRYELIDGVLFVSPAPRMRHQIAVRQMFLLLHEACPSDLEVLFAPVDVALTDDTVMQPDLLVARRADFTERDLPTAPVLAIEVLSPSTRAFDLLLKKDRLQRAGCAHYWVVDPDLPAITTWELVDGVYTDSGTATGDETLTLAEPFSIDIQPSALVVRASG